MDAEEMAAYFGVGVDDGSDSNSDSSSDYDNKASDKTLQTFEQQCEDIKSIMETESTPDDTRIIEDALQNAKDNPAPSMDAIEEVEDHTDTQNEQGDEYADEVSADIAEFDVEGSDIEEGEDESSVKLVETSANAVGQETGQPSSSSELLDDLELDVIDQPVEVDQNPLDLSGSDLKFFHECAKKYPEFNLFEGSVTFKEFYQYKLQVLKSLLTRFPKLDIRDLSKEIADVRTDHYIGDHAISPELIRKKIDDVYKCRARLSSILVQILEQFFVWEKYDEMLNAKLWKDHPVKGAHNRSGLSMEHMSDISDYVQSLKGVMESARHADSMQKAAADSLSRQLSCLQLQEPTGFTQGMDEKLDVQKHIEAKTKDSELDSFDSINAGETVNALEGAGSVSTCYYGVPADDLSELG